MEISIWNLPERQERLTESWVLMDPSRPAVFFHLLILRQGFLISTDVSCRDAAVFWAAVGAAACVEDQQPLL